MSVIYTSTVSALYVYCTPFTRRQTKPTKKSSSREAFVLSAKTPTPSHQDPNSFGAVSMMVVVSFSYERMLEQNRRNILSPSVDRITTQNLTDFK